MPGIRRLLVMVGGLPWVVVLLSTSAHAFIPATVTVRSRTTQCHAESPSSTASSTTDYVGDAPSARLGFLRTAGVTLARTVAGIGMLPRSSSAEVFTDETLGFQFETPGGWERSDAQISGRRKIIVYTSRTNPGANAFVAYSPVRGDFTSLGSFGTLDEVSKTILPEGDGVKSRLVDSYTKNTSYVYDYVVTQQGRPEKHIKTLWLLFPDQGQLATITAQCNEEDFGTLGKAIDGIIASIKRN